MWKLVHRLSLSVVTASLFVLAMTAATAAELNIQDLSGKDAPAGAVWLDTLDLSSVTTGEGHVGAGKTVQGKVPISINKQLFVHGIGVKAASLAYLNLKKMATRFVAAVGLDDENGTNGAVIFQVWVDHVKKADSGIMKGGDAAKLFSIDLTGASNMLLLVTDNGMGMDWNHADWAGAMVFTAASGKDGVEFIPMPNVMPKIASCDPARTSINGPRVVGTTPGKPFMFLVPATGQELHDFSAEKLPAGLKIDPVTGIIGGSVEKPGTYEVILSVKGGSGSASRKLVIEAGNHKLARTPPMGWNSWNCWAGAVSDAKVRAAADAMVKSGLAAHGFQYINIDDCWQRKEGTTRDASGEILSNDRFPDMKGLADYVHGKGLKLGIYSSPGPKTCAGFEGSYQHEQQDANTYAKWGVDYLKYDWCSYGSVAGNNADLEAMKKPYRVMSKAIDRCPRDIVFSLCQYGMSGVSAWGEEVGGNCWRTTEDIADRWTSLFGIGSRQNGVERYAGPGHWNDPDMLIVGKIGWGPTLRKTRLTYAEQVTHITLWSLLASPLLIGCDMSDMDKFTLDLLTNDEVLDVDQDPLGKQAGRVFSNGAIQVWSRPLHDGTTAVGIFNTDLGEGTEGTVKWADIGVRGSQPVRDLWTHKDLGSFDGRYSARLPAHGAVMLKIGTPSK